MTAAGRKREVQVHGEERKQNGVRIGARHLRKHFSRVARCSRRTFL